LFFSSKFEVISNNVYFIDVINKILVSILIKDY